LEKGICYGVSVGPGESELITYQAVKVIEKADVIFLPSFPKEECKAYIIAKGFMPEIDKKEIFAETFTMSKDVKVMEERHAEIFNSVKNYLDQGMNVAFLTLGEVSLYSTYLYIHERLWSECYCSKLISGISSIQAICSKLSVPLALGDEEVHIFPNAKELHNKLMLPGTKIFMKSRVNLLETIDDIKSFCINNRGITAMGVSNCGMEGEVIAKSVEELHNLHGYFTVIIVKEVTDYE